MVLTSEVNPVNRLYRELSGRYKAGWTFHRFIHGLRKFFDGQGLDDRTAEFQSLFKSLKEVSARLDEVDIVPVMDRLKTVRRSLDDLIEALDREDRKVAPSLVRLFFQRVKTRDERILIDLVRFYLEAQRGRDWEPERSDKVDYLLSRLGEVVTSTEGGGGSERLNRVLGGISGYLSASPVDPQKLTNRRKLIEAVRREVQKITTFEGLTERDLVAHYRKVKHGLGGMVFEKSILPLVVNTNLEVSARVGELTEKAQEKIFADYEKVSALEEQGLLTSDLRETVSKLHHQVGDFRDKVKGGTLRLDAVTEIQRAVQEIFGRIQADETVDLEEYTIGADPLAGANALVSAAEQKLLGELFQGLIGALRGARSAGDRPNKLDSGLLEYRLGAREIEAFARLSSGARCDPSLELFVLAASSLRRKIRLLVDELHNVVREATPETRREALDEANAALRIGDGYLRRFSHFLEMRIADGEAEKIRELQVLKMHLMREYSGLWLLVNESIRSGQR